MKKNILYRTVILLLVVSLSWSCSEDTMDEIAYNGNYPQNVQARNSMVDVMTSTAFSCVGGTLSSYTGIYVEHIAGVSQQFYKAETRSGEPMLATTYNNDWNAIYSNIRCIKDVIKKCSADGEENFNPVTLGVAKIMLAYNGALLTDVFGDTPFFESGVIDDKTGMPKYMQPKIDSQESIYKEIMTLLNDAEKLLEQSDRDPMDRHDLIFGGDVAKWKKVIPALKARYTMRLLHVTADKSKACKDVIVYVDSAFNSAKDQFEFNKYNGTSANNPLYGITSARKLTGASLGIIEKFDERSDPRVKYAYCDGYGKLGKKHPFYGKVINDVDTLKKYAFKNGESIDIQGGYPFLRAEWASSAPTILLSYHELLFIKAEAMARLENPGAVDVLKEAIKAGFKNLERSINISNSKLKYDKVNTSDKDLDIYFTESVLPLFTVNPVKEIMIQKYLSFMGSSGEAVEAYNDIRRLEALGENYIELRNPKNKDGKFPQRLTYGNSDVTANNNIKEAFGNGSYVYTEKVWWAGGKR